MPAKTLLAAILCITVFTLLSPGAPGQESRNEIADSPAIPLIWQWSPVAGTPLQTVIDIPRSLMYVALKEGGVAILKLQNPLPPQPLSKVPKLFLANLDAVAIAQKGNFLYVGLGDLFAHRYAKAGLVTIDVSDPTVPHVVSLWQSPQNTGGSSSLLIHEDNLYLGAMTQGVYVFSLTSPSHPQFVSSFQPDPNYPIRNPDRVHRPNVRSMAAYNQLLFVCYDSGGLRVLDISDKKGPREVGRYLNENLLGQQQAYNGIVLSPPHAYLTCDYAGVEVVDITKPESIRRIAWWDPWRRASGRNFWFGSKGHANQVEMDRTSKRLFVSAGDSELIVLDVKNPLEPRVCAHYGGIKDNAGAWGVTYNGGIAYLSCIKALIPFRSIFSGIRALNCSP
ncbi:MAG: hypothetical protein IT342_04510 [Candidatus Melainabacteria bacterium]|nr:hypothetical protein [Candidatus Melainabacteria bacterium]